MKATLIIILVFCMFASSVYASVWWTGTPNYVINDSTTWNNATFNKTNTYDHLKQNNYQNEGTLELVSTPGLPVTKYSSNPIMSPGAGGEFDSNIVLPGKIIKDENGIYHMWYSGHNGANYKIGYANSTDGVTWTKYSGNPVLNIGGGGAWDDLHVFEPEVIKDGNTYHMWYTGYGSGTGKYQIGYANSTDGFHWTKYTGNPIMSPAGVGWDVDHIEDGSVILENGTYHMWYAARDGTNWRIGYANGTDPMHFTKYAGNPIVDLGGGWDWWYVIYPFVMKDNDTYHMWYGGFDGGNYQIGYANGTSPMHFTKDDANNPVIPIGGWADWDSTRVTLCYGEKELGLYKLWFSGYDGGTYKTGYSWFNLSYEPSGDWLSSLQNMMSGYKLKNMTINLTADANNYLDKIEWLDNAGTVLASNDTDIKSSGVVTYSNTRGFTSGSFNSVSVAFKIKLYLKGNAGSPKLTPVIDDIIGFTEPSAGIEFSKFYSLEPYTTGNSVETLFAENQTVKIRANMTSTILGGAFYPILTLYYPNGSVAVNQQNMTNESQLSNSSTYYFYNYTIPDNTTGFWKASIVDSNSNTYSKQNIFYTGQVWSYGWTNKTGTTYPFRMTLNISEANVLTRRWQVVDTWINFTYSAYNNSVRLCFNNTTNLIEIPSQLRNETYNADGTLSGANIVFITSITRNSNKTFYVFYSKYDLGPPNYASDLYTVNNSNKFIFNNSNYNVTNDKGRGGAIEYLKTQAGTSLAGDDPFEYGAEIYTIGGVMKNISGVSVPENVTLTIGPVFSTLRINSRYVPIGNSVYYNATYTYYTNTPYYVEELNTTNPTSDDWQYYKDLKNLIADSLFQNVSWFDTSITTHPAISGNGPDYTGLTNIVWIAFYNNNTRNAFGDIFLANRSSASVAQTFDYYDTAAFEMYQRSSGTISPAANAWYYIKKAGVVWDSADGISNFNSTYYQLANPINVSFYTSEANDTTSPQYMNNTNYLNYTPTSPNNNASITCFSFWSDNLGIDHVTLRENSSGAFTNHESLTASQGNLSGWANYTITTSNPGNISCNFTAYDIAGNTNMTNFTLSVSDVLPPQIENVTYSPSSEIDIDPNVTINVTANITDLVAVYSAKLQYRLNDTGAWTNVSMTHLAGSAYNATFKPDVEGNWTIRVVANDTSGNANQTSSQNLSVAYDMTWYLTPTTFGDTSSQFDTTVNLTNITINNTGDYELNFSISLSGYDTSLVKYNVTNESQINVPNMTSKVIQVNITSGSSISTNAIIFTVTANQSTMNSTSKTQTGTYYVSPSGPYLVLTAVSYPTSIAPGNTTTLSVKVRNMGNESANKTWIRWVLPTGWSVDPITDTLNLTVGNVSVYGTAWNNLSTVRLASTVVTGTQTIYVQTNSSTGGYSNTSFTVVVEGSTPTPTPTPEPTPVNTGGGGVGGGISAGEKEKLFQTSGLYEMTRGEDSSFILKVENPFPNSTMDNISVKVTGLLAKYISVIPPTVDEILPGNYYNFTIRITTPAYFTTGEHKLVFTIHSSVKNLATGYITGMVEDRAVTLAVHDVSRLSASDMLDSGKNMLDEMIKLDLYTVDIKSLLDKADQAYQVRNYEEVKSLYDQVSAVKDNAFTSKSLIDQMTKTVSDAANFWGLKTEQTERIINLAKLAFSRGDYATALQRIQQAQLTFAIETKGEYNIPFILLHYWNYILLGIVSGLIISYLSYKRIKFYLLTRRIKLLGKEEQIILGLMKVVQTDTFEKGKSSMGEYINTMVEYEKRLNEVVKDIIKYETERSHIFKLGGRTNQLIDERNRLIQLIKQTQGDYMQGAKIETRIYINKMHSYSERFSEIQENLAILEAKRALRGSSTFEKIRGKFFK